MTLFWILAGVMAVLALFFIAVPVLRSRHRTDVDRDQLNTAVIREQLAELGADMEAGKLDADAFESAHHDLERELLNAIDETPDKPRASSRSGRWLLAILLPAIPLLAVMLYLQLGVVDPSQQASQAAQAANDNSGGMPEHEINAVLEELAQRLAAEPDHADGWILLARSYASLQRFDEAAAAYEQARKYGGDTPELLVDYADTLIAASGGNFSDEVGAMLKKALAQQPDNLKGLWLFGHWLYQHGNYQGALDNWQAVAAQAQAGSETSRVLQQQIQLARSKLGTAAPAETKAPPAENDSGGASLRVKVSLDPSLKDSAAPDDTVFIFARAVSGPRMPLAIVRKQVRDLPVTVTLDDSLAMSPAMVLSRFPQVSIGARISKTGQAMPAAGDLQGTREPVSTRNAPETVNVVINAKVGQ
ncbi:cytochrome c-type biogenesis protein CcmH [Thiogranum longum]|uniref:Cytochrome c-type biogenesis protein CcmH n=1 Tax=Thiogranum longum TaxID=1537524 RepID=A0A4R1HB59_9GAMM|nr:c-type cytochrome biogenesis protein CcmI [Thiogranum longum]TCK18608.1 cytochrome c-type biogenesis protein CcmH [Thiogranum longum]